MSSPWDLGHVNYIWATWAHRTYPSTSPEPWLQFSQTGPHFLKNHEINSIKSRNLKKCLDLGPKNYIWATWAQKMYLAIIPEPWLQFSQTGPRFLKNHKINPIKLWNLKKCLELGAWDVKTTFGPFGPRRQPAISPEPWLQFWQTGAHFLKNLKSNKIMKFQKMSWPWDLGPRNHI